MFDAALSAHVVANGEMQLAYRYFFFILAHEHLSTIQYGHVVE
jgi:hypothetical protein